MRITALPSGSITGSDYLALDNTTNGTRKISVNDLGYTINLTSATVSDIYNSLHRLSTNSCAYLVVASNVASILTGGNVSNTALKGFVHCVNDGNGTYDIFLMHAGGDYNVQERITITSSTITVNEFYKYVSDKRTSLTLTRTTNSFVDSTAFGRLEAYRQGGWYWFFLNLQVTTAGTMSDWVEIGSIANYSALDPIYANIPGMANSSSVLTLYLTSAGKINIYCGTGTLASTFYRGVFAVPQA